MNNSTTVRSLRLLLLSAIAIMGLSRCSSDNGNETNELVLNPTKTEITDSGHDYTQFTVTFNGTDVTAASTIRNVSDNVVLDEPRFSATVAGTKTFTATYDNRTSDPVTITISSTNVDQTLQLGKHKDEFRADGTDFVVITLTKDGSPITPENFTIIHENTGEALERGDGNYRFSTTEAGEHRFHAVYGSSISPTMTITATAPLDYSFYHQTVIFSLASVRAQATHMVTEYIDEAKAAFPDRILELNVHATPNGALEDPMEVSNATTIADQFLYSDGRYFIFGEMNVNLLDVWVMRFQYASAERLRQLVTNALEIEATSGFSVNSTVSGNTASAEITVKSTLDKNYRLGVMLIENNIAEPQLMNDTEYDENFIHNGVFRYNATDIDGEYIGNIGADQEKTFTYTLDVSRVQNLDNAKILVYTIANTTLSGTTYMTINNAMYANVEGTTPYKYNE